jgi:hypothetical protein
LTKTCGFQPSAEGFAYIHKVHYQPKVVSSAITGDQESKAQYGCYNFVYHNFVFGPMTAYHNKWEDWTSCWFYHKVQLDLAIEVHPIMVKQIQPLPAACPNVDVVETVDLQAFENMLR